MEPLDSPAEFRPAALNHPRLTGGLVHGQRDVGIVVEYELHAGPPEERAKAVACFRYYATRSMQRKAKLRPSQSLIARRCAMPRHGDLTLVFQHRLKTAREMKQRSQKQLGIDAGLDPNVASARINRYELGVHQPDMETVEKLAKALHVPASYLFAGDERLARMILAFDKLSAAEKDRLLDDIDG